MAQTNSIGTEQTLVVCAASQISQAPCPSGMAPNTIVGYVIDPTKASSIDAQNAEFDYAVAAQIWGLAFTFVVGLYLVSKSAGMILAAVRNF